MIEMNDCCSGEVMFAAADESVETGSCCHYNQPGTNAARPVDMFRILRLAYSKPIGQLLVSLPVIHPVTYQTFSPQHVRVRELGVSFRERFEKMKETFDKVVAFLQTTGPTYFLFVSVSFIINVSIIIVFPSWHDTKAHNSFTV